MTLVATPPTTPSPPFWRRPCWQFAAAAFLLGVVDIGMAIWAGLDFRLAGRDVTTWVGLFLQILFAIFGYLLGLLVESRRAERSAALHIRKQLEEIAVARTRLAQQEKLASLGQLASTLAHEVRNPLAIIRSLVQNLEETFREDDLESPAACRTVLDEIDRLSRVVTSLVAFARPLQLHAENVAPATVVERTQLLAQPLLDQHQVKLETAVSSPAGTAIHADSDLLCQVLLGLLANAAEASPIGGRVRLLLRVAGEEVAFEVSDSGPGVSEDIRDRIFEPFLTTRSDGSGLGLAVARQIVAAHGGRLDVDDAVGGGARFSVFLPAGETVSTLAPAGVLSAPRTARVAQTGS